MTGILLLHESRNPELPSREGSCNYCGYCGDVVLLVQVLAGIIFVVKGGSGVGITEHVVFNVTLILLTVQVSKLWIF